MFGGRIGKTTVVNGGFFVFIIFLLVIIVARSEDVHVANSYEQNLVELKSVPAEFSAYSDYFLNLAEEAGAVYAYNLLRQIPFPNNIDQHLLGHVVGDELYRQEGLSGMQYCTDDFRNACSHTIVIGALLERGMEVFADVNDVCQLAPGGRGAYTMCFHGFGHGVLAFTGYDMAQAVELCMRTGTDEYHQQEAYECVGGAVMEMKDGIHDKEIWKPQKEKYVDENNPLSICQAEYMPTEAKERCYAYITPYLFDAAGAAGSLPTPNIFADSFAYCEHEPNEQYRLLCYRGFGKEFIMISADFNQQQVETLPDEKLAKNISWCEEATDPAGVLECKKEVVNSLFWGGENDYQVSLRYCGLWAQADAVHCYDTLFQNITYYVPNDTYKAAVCRDTPREYVDKCKTMLGVST